jgi:hypothetical protein
MAHGIFISYAPKDKSTADIVVSWLERNRINCWIAPRDLRSGIDWGTAIVEAIQGSKVVVIIFSENANNSKQVMREVELAITKGLDVIPFRVEDINPSGLLSYFLSTTHWIDGFPPPIEGHLDQLVKTLQVYLGIKTEATGGDQTNEMKEDRQKGQGERGGFFKRLFNKGIPDDQAEASTVSEGQNRDMTAEKAGLKIIDSLKVQRGTSKGVIQFCVGDVTQASPDQAVDVLVTSAYRDQYYPVPGSVFGSLYRQGIHVEDLAENKEVDLRGAFSCWLSKEILNPPEGIQFKRILCYEPEETARAGEQIGDIFRSLAPFIGGQDPIRSVGTTLVAAGSSRRITQQESLQLLVEAAVHWMSSGLPIEHFKIICLPNQDVDKLTQLFAELKLRYSSALPQRQNQFSYDFFISYSHKDTREVDLFVDLLLAQNRDLQIFIDKKALNPGSAWQREIYEAIDDCRKVATFFSPTYLDSKVCIEEFNIALCRHRESEEPILKPIYLYSANLPTYMRLIQFFDCRESNRDKLKQAAVNLLQDLA